MKRRSTAKRAWRAIFAVFIVATALGALMLARGASAQLPPPPTPPGTPAIAGPPPDIAGEWSITRSWLRRCPRCSSTVIRTTPWVITQTGQAVRIDRGLRGTIGAAPGGGGYLHLEGVESGGAGPKRFWYSTLDVDPSGNGFQGGFAGSETIQNPCGSFPPMVTCMVSAGWIRAYRVSPVATVPTPPGPPTVLPPVPKATASPSATPPPTERAGPTPSAIPSPTPRTPPPVPLYLPVTWLDA